VPRAGCLPPRGLRRSSCSRRCRCRCRGTSCNTRLDTGAHERLNIASFQKRLPVNPHIRSGKTTYTVWVRQSKAGICAKVSGIVIHLRFLSDRRSLCDLIPGAARRAWALRSRTRMLRRQMTCTWSLGSVRTPTQAPAASLRRHSCDLIARRRSLCVGPPHSHTHAASTDDMYLVVG
jgi:hypothetical protein